ncbi:MAG TPA: hypothetical protein VLU46_14080 [Thermoanaerobaculia bacterium]|nr:hypothetical protein [Thermoanaerobaculia bacterium]
MLFAWVFEPAFTGLGVLLACAAVAAAFLASSDHERDTYHADMTERRRR